MARRSTRARDDGSLVDTYSDEQISEWTRQDRLTKRERQKLRRHWRLLSR